MKVDIYLATSPSGKFYVGITKKGLKARIWYHYSQASKGSKLAFHNCLRKYGKTVKFEVLKTVESWEEACQLEKAYIIQFNSQVNGYNITAGGNGVCGVPCPEHLKQLYRTQQLGRIRPLENRLNCSIGKGGKPFLMINKITNEVTEWQNLRECHRVTGVNKTYIRRCLLGLRPSAKGFKFRYKEAA